MARHSGGIISGFALLVAIVSCALFFGLIPKPAHAAINPQINFQGKLTNPDGTNVATSTYSIVFSIYTVSVAGTAVWTETQPAVQVTDGIFQVSLGSVSALPGSVDFNGSSLYLGIAVAGDPEMTPRVRFSAAPYAHNSDAIDGLDGTDLVQLGQSASAQTDGSTFSSIFINKTSSGNFLQLQGSGVDNFSVTNAGNILFGQNAAHTIGVAQESTNAAGNALSIQAGQGGTGAGANSGGQLNIEGGDGGGTNGPGGDVVISGGVGAGSGVAGDVYVHAAGNSVTSFVVEDATSVAMLTVNTTDDEVLIGSATTDTTQVTLQLDSFSTYTESVTCNSTTNQGGLYYNTNSNVIRGCIDGAWEDLPSTRSLGLMMFGVVPDSANAGAPGDLGGISALTNSPCMVTRSATQQVTVNPCVAFSGGRKVVVPSTAISTAGLAANAYANVCLTGANNQPALGAGNATETSAAVPAFNISNPILCLATVRASGVAGNVGFIWDVRTFTTTDKTFATISSVNSPGYLVVKNATNNQSVTSAANSAGSANGIVIATTGTSSTTAVNAVIAIAGPQFVKVPNAGTAVAGAIVQTVNTAGYARTAAVFTSNYANFGILQRGQVAGACNAATNCQYSGLVNLSISR